MLKIYAAHWCPHCRKTIAFLEREKIPYEYIDVDTMTPETERLLDKVNGGEWLVPTLEYEGKWRPGETYNEERLRAGLKELGALE